MDFTWQELNLIRQWFNAVEDLAPKYLEQPDRDLARKIKERMAEAAAPVSDNR